MREVLSPLVVRMLVGVGLNALGGGLTMALLLVYLTQIRGISTSQATVTLTLMAIISLLITGPVGTLVDRFGPQPVMLVGLVVDAIAVGMWSQVHNVRDAYLVGVISAIGGSTIWPPQSAMIARITPTEHRQRVYGIQFMLLNAGLGLGAAAEDVVHRHRRGPVGVEHHEQRVTPGPGAVALQRADVLGVQFKEHGVRH